MSQPVTTTPTAPAQPRKRWGRRILKAFLLLIVVALVAYFLFSFLGGRELAAAIAEADRLDPGWRLDDLEAAGRDIPDDENAARRVAAAHRLLAGTWPGWPPEQVSDPGAMQKRLAELSADEPLTQLQIDALKGLLKNNAAALAEARKLADMPRGRCAPGGYAHSIWRGAANPHVVLVREVTELLSYDILLRAQMQDLDGALASCRALVNASASAGDDPSFDTQFRRLLRRTAIARKIERVLAQGEASEAALAALQRTLAEEEAQPLFLWAARANRAAWDQLFGMIEAGEFRNESEFLLRNLHWMGMNADRASTLKLNTEIVEIAKAPLEERDQMFAEKQTMARHMPIFSREFLRPKVQKLTIDLHAEELRTRAELRSVIAALAAERYRRAQGAWPERLAALTPAQLEATLIDPYDGQALRWRRVPDGAVIYSVGPDQQDNGGTFDAKKKNGPGVDLGLRLWDVSKRRRTAEW
jgi:hypothetical protein